jgi:hypothetical protein
VGFRNRVEQKLWTGEVLKDYGPISERKYRFSTCRVSVVLAQKNGANRLWIRESRRGPLAASVRFLELDSDAVMRLGAALEDALPQMDGSDASG